MDRLTRALPLAISEMGKREFSALAFRFFDDDPLAREPAADVVEDFILYLERTGVAPHAVVVALFELARCHCADIGPPPLLTSELQRMPVSRLLTMQVARHPGARAIEVAGQVPMTLLSLYPNLKGGDGILLAKRIGGDLVLPLAMAELAMFRRLAQPCDLVNILGAADAANDAAATFHRLVRLGVIVEVRQDGEGVQSTAGGFA
ncbi:hypothetical protein KRR38_26800 [Novosphingobium sp. G106]|uniref:hypothetical protein n=1 Tax=Novosphingobium sp. G106 TaxID=2849500 RepID=UPI001C2D556C|nr:hypothetical protein [Novosphingobium sp. G106]MBV1691193.1 hypothetical protein [Novosphingobium sp. G106]